MLCVVARVCCRPWFNPWHLHHLPRHAQDFIDRVARCGPAFAQSGLFAIPAAMNDPATATLMATAAAAASAAAAATSATMRAPVAPPTNDLAAAQAAATPPAAAGAPPPSASSTATHGATPDQRQKP